MKAEQLVLGDITRVPGVRSALLASLEDGLVIAESSLEGENTEAAAALAARLVQRLGRLTDAVGHAPLTLALIQATDGQVFAASGGEGLILIAITNNDVNIGEVRLALLDAAGRLG